MGSYSDRYRLGSQEWEREVSAMWYFIRMYTMLECLINYLLLPLEKYP